MRSLSPYLRVLTVGLSSVRLNSNQLWFRRCIVVGGTTSAIAIAIRLHSQQHICQCQQVINQSDTTSNFLVDRYRHRMNTNNIATRLLHTLRLIIRTIRLFASVIPLMIAYPLCMMSERSMRIWWSAIYWLVRHSDAPALIKLAQWSATRRDLFSDDYCRLFAILQRNVGGTNRPWRDSDAALQSVFGADWEQMFVELDRKPTGSGCIAQVYKGIIDADEFYRKTGISIDQSNQQNGRVQVAVKIAHRNILDNIRIDLSIMRAAANILQFIAPALSFVDPIECLNQFENVLERQVDLRHEAQALKRFGDNFKNDRKSKVRFATPFYCSENILIETYESGMHVSTLLNETVPRKSDDRLKQQVAKLGIRALLKMIFVDNFVHGDLHPGNILVQLRPDEETSIIKTTLHNIRSKVMHIFNQEVASERNQSSTSLTPHLVILDTGIAIEQSRKNLENLRAVFEAIVDNNGYAVGELMLSEASEQKCTDPHRFCTEIAEIVDTAVSERSSLRQLNISEMLSKLFSIVAKHRVQMEPAFSCVIAAVMIVEGVGRTLDPDLDLFDCARPYVLAAASL